EDGDVETATVSTVYIQPKAAAPTKDVTKDYTPRVDPITERAMTPRKPFRTEAPVPVTEDTQRYEMTSTTSVPGSPQEAVEVHSDNLFHRTEVLA
ncbi:hypothetical protein NL108_009874, partial [Boleophthalmus pectinirostris]